MEQDAPTSTSARRPWARTGAIVRQVRERLGATQHELGVRIGYCGSSANATVCKIEAGRICPTSDKLAAISALDGHHSAADLLTAVGSDSARRSRKQKAMPSAALPEEIAPPDDSATDDGADDTEAGAGAEA